MSKYKKMVLEYRGEIRATVLAKDDTYYMKVSKKEILSMMENLGEAFDKSFRIDLVKGTLYLDAAD